MKIRWTKNSVRFRITPLEFAAIERGERVCEVLCLPEGASWCAAIVPDADDTLLVFDAGELRVLLGEADRKLLAEPDREGVYFQLAPRVHPDGEMALRYFIEKDFPCAHPRAADALEPPTETFAPPPGFEERKNA